MRVLSSFVEVVGIAMRPSLGWIFYHSPLIANALMVQKEKGL